MTTRDKALRIGEHWFLLGIGVAVILAYLFPSAGSEGSVLRPGLTTKAAIFCIFLMCGLKSDWTVVLDSLWNARLMAMLMLYSFVAFPALGLVFSRLLLLVGADPVYSAGFLVATCMPPPASAGVILTGNMCGDESTAVAISVAGNVASIVVSPLLLSCLVSAVRADGARDLLVILFLLVGMVLVPLLVGQLVGQLASGTLRVRLAEHKSSMSVVSNLLLLFVIFCSVSSVFSDDGAGVEAGDGQLYSLLLVVVGIVVTQLVMCGLITGLEKYLERGSVSAKWRIPLVMCCSQKSLSTGVTIASLLFPPGQVDRRIVVPLLLFEPIQITLGSVVGSVLFGPENSPHCQASV